MQVPDIVLIKESIWLFIHQILCFDINYKIFHKFLIVV